MMSPLFSKEQLPPPEKVPMVRPFRTETVLCDPTKIYASMLVMKVSNDPESIRSSWLDRVNIGLSVKVMLLKSDQNMPALAVTGRWLPSVIENTTPLFICMVDICVVGMKIAAEVLER